MATQRTTAPGHHVLLYDGHCRFCTAQSGKLVALARDGAIVRMSFQDPGVLEQFPGLTYDQCMQEMQLIAPDGRVFSGFEAAVRALATRLVGRGAYIYYLPGLRQLCDAGYAWVARNRYRLMGKEVAAGACDGGTCHLHLKKPSA